MHGLERWRQQAKRPLSRPATQGRVPAYALLDGPDGATGGERTRSRSARGEEARVEWSISAAMIAAGPRRGLFFRQQRGALPAEKALPQGDADRCVPRCV
jgi:hypothetical protein